MKSEWCFLNVLLALKTFVITSFIWIFFRAENFQKAKDIFIAVFRNNDVPNIQLEILIPLLFSGFIIIFDIFLYNSRFDLKLNTFKTHYRWAFYTVLLFCLMALSGTQKFSFIYFQF